MTSGRLREAAAGNQGRPRDPRTDRAILDATVAVVAERGFARLTVDEVALRAGVGKATIYRRWPSKLPLVIESVCQLSDEKVPVPDSGTLRGDVQALIESFVGALTSPLGQALVRLVSEAATDPQLRHTVHEELIVRRQKALGAILERGIAKGEIRPDADVDLVLEVGTAALLHRLVVSDRPLDLDYASRVVELLLDGLSPGGDAA